MIRFLKLTISPKEGRFENISYLPAVIGLVEKYKHCLLDDYFLDGYNTIVDALLALIERVTPYFWVVADSKGNLCGFIYLDDWTGAKNNPHSASVTTCFAPEYHGRFTKFAGRRFVKYVFKRYKLKKLKAEIYARNGNAIALLRCLGFEYEATLKSETMVNSTPTDINVYSIIKA